MHHAAKTLLAALVLSLAALGCSSSHETLSAASGVYDLTIAGEADACSPMRATGPMGTAAIVRRGAVLTLTAPDLTSSAPMLVALDGATGYANERSETLSACTDATLTRSYTVVGTSASGLDVAYRETWTGLSTCGTAMHYVMPLAPTADCAAELVLHYQLQTECSAPCELHLAADGSALCHCG